MVCIVAISVAVLAAAASAIQAEQIRLAEFIYDGGTQPVNGTQLPNLVSFTFITSRGDPNTQTNWITDHTPSDTGQTISASLEIVEGIASVASFPDTIFFATISNPFGAFSSGRFDELTPPGTGVPTEIFQLRLRKYVPNLAPYRITQVERTLNSVVLRWLNTNNDIYGIGGKQTVTLYGVLVPEPASVLLFVIVRGVFRRYS